MVSWRGAAAAAAAVIAAAALAGAGCGGARGAGGAGAANGAALATAAVRGGGDVTLYRDRAFVRQRIEVDIPSANAATRLRIEVAAGVGPDDVIVFDRGGLAIAELRATGAIPAIVPPAPAASPSSDADGLEFVPPEPTPEASRPNPDQPAVLELVASAPRAGRTTLVIGYPTDRLTWQVAYTMTTGPARDAAVLRGALAIRNTAGIALRDAVVRLVDQPYETMRARTAEQLSARLAKKPRPKPKRGEIAADLPPPRELGRLDLLPGETRAELVRGAAPRRMRPVLVYDPIGAKLDQPGSEPSRDPALGVRPPPGGVVSESYEYPRDPATAAGLPAGPVRLLERRADGSLALLGEARLFEATTRVANTDTISVGTAAGVAGRRERRELTIDEDRKRVVEEFAITIENGRPHPVEVVLREHLYRGENWTLAYLSVSAGDEAKEGSQQVAPRITVPARARRRMLYTVVYWW